MYIKRKTRDSFLIPKSYLWKNKILSRGPVGCRDELSITREHFQVIWQKKKIQRKNQPVKLFKPLLGEDLRSEIISKHFYPEETACDRSKCLVGRKCSWKSRLEKLWSRNQPSRKLKISYAESLAEMIDKTSELCNPWHICSRRRSDG